ncbi:MAG: cation transporter [Ignavibacteria bacterium]|jgi:cobalt-zinc-cadmium efflux system protein|nr:cation transporter [Ignavibacteria bacterium]MCU7503959.1 cation transporter [Ignavibacteria bacterium]MCU7515820.1 cation transporter [Ignavibacteria bacterium]
MSHNRSQQHAHEHYHGPAGAYNRIFALGIGLNLIYVLVEAAFGFSINSLALIADAGHNLSDVLGLVLAWGASLLVQRPPTEYRTYGFRKTSIFAALLNAVILLITVGMISFEAIQRLRMPEGTQGGIMIIVAFIGVLVNTATAILFLKERKTDLNIKGAFMHMAADAAVSLGVVASGIIILYTGWERLDPILSLVISLVIVLGTWGLLRESFDLAMDAVPAHIPVQEVIKYLQKLPGVKEVHDLHIWPLSTTETALTVHIVKPDAEVNDELTSRICRELHDKFGIDHPTIQIEKASTSKTCRTSNV